jgi:hypothetical protein
MDGILYVFLLISLFGCIFLAFQNADQKEELDIYKQSLKDELAKQPKHGKDGKFVAK